MDLGRFPGVIRRINHIKMEKAAFVGCFWRTNNQRLNVRHVIFVNTGVTIFGKISIISVNPPLKVEPKIIKNKEKFVVVRVILTLTGD